MTCKSTHQPRRWHEQRAFTLIELLVVLSIVATLLLLVAPRYFQHETQARETVLRENLRLVRVVIDQFRADRGRYPDSLQELVDLHYLRALPIDPITGSAHTWRIEPPPVDHPGQVHDIRSGAPGTDQRGDAYANW